MKKDTKVAALLRAERARSGPDEGARARVLAHVQKTLAIAPLPLSSTDAPPAPAPVAPPAPVPLPPVPMGHPLGALVGGLGSAGKAVVLVASLAAVGAGVAATHGRTSSGPPPRSEPAHVVATASPPRTPRAVAPSPHEASPAPPPAPSASAHGDSAPPVARRAQAPAEAPTVLAPATPLLAPRAETLAAERALLDGVRGSLRAHDAPAALIGLDRYEAAFPSGALAEEAEALRIESLAAAGRGDEARRLGARFRSAHPSSLLAPAVDDALQSIP